MEIPMDQSRKNDFDVVPKIEYYNPERANVQKHVKQRRCLKT